MHGKIVRRVKRFNNKIIKSGITCAKSGMKWSFLWDDRLHFFNSNNTPLANNRDPDDAFPLQLRTQESPYTKNREKIARKQSNERREIGWSIKDHTSFPSWWACRWVDKKGLFPLKCHRADEMGLKTILSTSRSNRRNNNYEE